MIEIYEFEVKKDTSKIEVAFQGIRNIERVYLKIKSDREGSIKIDCAQNGVISDPVYLGEWDFSGNDVITADINGYLSISNLFIALPNKDTDIEEIKIFEKNEENEKCYPMCRDFDLSENYILDTVSVFTPSEGYCNYSLYTSVDGRNFDFLARKSDKLGCKEKTGDVYEAGGKEARIIRLYMEYNSVSPDVSECNVKFTGKKSGTKEELLGEEKVKKFDETDFNKNISQEDTFEEIYGLIGRRLGEAYKDWFEFSLEENPACGHDFDYFSVKSSDGKVLITGNKGVSLTMGLNYYLKYLCKVNISQVGDQVKMPEKILIPEKEIFKETKAKIRYAYNYCTHSYSMAFWGEKEWRDELDWLALNGVNAVLDITAQEEVWRRFLEEIGYTYREIKEYITGPAYYAWAYMANMFGYGGPVHDTWFSERTELARKNHLIMRKLGMYPIMQGYSGQVPPDVEKYNEEADVIPQGKWGGFMRPFMLKTTSKSFEKYAEIFYRVQKEVYGSYSHFYATDPFHEGGIIGDMKPREISERVLSEMLKADENAVWVIQSWQGNPTSELLLGIADADPEKKHALVLDLYAEKQPNFKNGGVGNASHGYSDEFDKTPWIYCMLNNFGGRVGLHGHLDNIARDLPQVFNNCEKIFGIGITPESSENNPVLYDFLFENIWQSNALEKMSECDTAQWIYDYAERRYGTKSENAEKAWDILLQTVYKAEFNNLGQGAPESVVNANPCLKPNAASTWGNAIIGYDKNMLQRAAEFLAEDFDKLKGSEGYRYDLISVLQQVLSNRAQDIHNELIKRFDDGDRVGFEKCAKEFLNIADEMEEVLSCSEFYLLGRWVGRAKNLAKNADDFTRSLYMFNAKCLITTWGAYKQGAVGTIKDYSNRQWAGMISDFYKPRWEMYFDMLRTKIGSGEKPSQAEYFEWEWDWIRSGKEYPQQPAELKPETVKKILFA